MTRRILGLAAAMLAVGALAACNSVPNSGPVREGLSSLDQVERAYMFNPSRPSPGADQDAIVRGFVRAAASSDRDYEVAREFLTPVYADQWDPSLGVLVVEGSQQVQLLQDDLAVLSLHIVASIDARGTMTLSEPGGQSEVQFELTKVKGEWRISSAPAGIILDRPTFTAVWSQRSVYFVSQDGRIVADPRWFLNRPTIATQIVRELLSGPSEAMEQVLHTELPAGTALTSGSVPVDDGIAEIDLSAELLEANETSMDRIRRQIVSSLQSVPGVTGYELSVHGSLVSSGPVSATPEASSSVVVMREGQFGVVSEGAVKPIPGLSERVSELSPTAASVSSDRKSALVLHSGGVSYVGEAESRLIDERKGLLTPSLDPLGYAWIYDPAHPAEVTVDTTPRAFGVPGEPSRTIPLPWLEGERVVALRVSMGGNRIAALAESEGGSVVLVAGIIRDPAGTPVGVVDTAVAEMWETGAPIDLDWVGDTRFAALTTTGLLGNSSRVTNGVVGQFSTERGTVSGGTAISGGGSWAQQLRVLDDQHRMFSPQGVGWQQALTGVDFIAKVG